MASPAGFFDRLQCPSQTADVRIRPPMRLRFTHEIALTVHLF